MLGAGQNFLELRNSFAYVERVVRVEASRSQVIDVANLRSGQKLCCVVCGVSLAVDVCQPPNGNWQLAAGNCFLAAAVHG